MITGEPKNKIDGLWDIFAAGSLVNPLDEIYRLMNESQAVDVRGDTYEYLLSKISQSGRNGQFRTPRHIIRMMVELMDPKADDVICEITIPSLIQSRGKTKKVCPCGVKTVVAV